MRKWLSILLCLIMLTTMTACASKPEPEPEAVDEPQDVIIPEPEPEPEPEPMPWDLYDLNKLTGIYDMDKEFSGFRPVAVMVNNITHCLPQRGFTDTDLLLEIEVEGGITRTMAFFSDYRKIDQCGSVRSLRNQFLDLARPLDAMIVHVGSSAAATSALREYGYRTIDAMSSANVFQDKSRVGHYASEHTWFTDAQHISDCITALDMRTEDESPDPIFNFAEYGTEAPVDDGGAITAEWKFSKSYDSFIRYSRNSEGYMFWQHGDLRYDELTGKPFYFQNVFIIVASRPGYYGSSTSPRYDYSQGGYGYYLYKGHYEEFTWSKESDEARMILYAKDGTELKVNPGRSYVAIVNTYQADTIQFTGSPEDDIAVTEEPSSGSEAENGETEVSDNTEE